MQLKPCLVVSVQVCVGDMWVDIVWACILISVWLRGQIRAGEWCYEVVGSYEVQQGARCNFVLPCNPIKTCVYVCVCLSVCGAQRLLVSDGVMSPSLARHSPVVVVFDKYQFSVPSYLSPYSQDFSW